MRSLVLALFLLPLLTMAAGCGGTGDTAQADPQPAAGEPQPMTESEEPSSAEQPAEPIVSPEPKPQEIEALEEPSPSPPAEPAPAAEMEQAVPAPDPSRGPAPAVRGPTLDGSELALADFLGTPVFVNVWASW